MTVIVDDKKLQGFLKKYKRKLDKPDGLLKIYGETTRTSVIQNFEKEGRPKKWAPLSPTTVKLRKAAHPILRRQGFAGGLAGSVNYKVEANKSRVVTAPNKPYSALMQFGAKRGSFGSKKVTIKAHVRKVKSRSKYKGKGKKKKKTASGIGYVKKHQRKMVFPWGDIPGRPYMMLQPADIKEMKSATIDYLKQD